MRRLYLDLPALCFISLGCSPLLLPPRTQVLNETLDSPSLDIYFFFKPEWESAEFFFSEMLEKQPKNVSYQCQT